MTEPLAPRTLGYRLLFNVLGSVFFMFSADESMYPVSGSNLLTIEMLCTTQRQYVEPQ